MSMQTAEWVIAGATLLGPILAVQAQKAIERARERRSRKTWVFQTLMATRAARISTEHVKALNMIDLVFYGRRVLGILRRSKAEQSIIDAWHEYLDHLNTKYDDKTFELWNAKGEELFVNLLFAAATAVGFKFDRVQLKKGAYSPVAHGNLEFEQQLIRKMTLGLLSGETALKMDVSSFPMNQEVLDKQIGLQNKMLDAFEGRGALTIDIKQKE
jgi:hypothetical protein